MSDTKEVLEETQKVLSVKMADIFSSTNVEGPTDEVMEVLRDRLLNMIYDNT